MSRQFQKDDKPTHFIQNEQQNFQNYEDDIGALNTNRPRKKSIHRKQRFMKLICIAFLLSGFVYYRFIHEIASHTKCIFDAYQQYTFDLNRKLYNGWDNAIIGIGQVIMDSWIVISIGFWLYKIQNFRLPFSAGFFFGIRSLFLILQWFPFPQFMVWHSPGFISLTVPYDHTRDFFYSGHTGSLTIILIEFSQFTVNKNKKFSAYIWVIIFFCLIYMMNMLIITRVHYTVDIIGGLIFSIYMYWIVGKYLIWLDKLASLPYVFIIEPLILKWKNKKKKKSSTLQQEKQNITKSLDDKLLQQNDNQRQK